MAELIDQESSRKLARRLKLAVVRAETSIQPGTHSGVLKGQGLEYRSSEPYVPGDDIRSIDWKNTAKFQKPFVKRFDVDRRQSIRIVYCDSPSMDYPNDRTSKHLCAQSLAIVFCWIAQSQKDPIGVSTIYSAINTKQQLDNRHIHRTIQMIADMRLQNESNSYFALTERSVSRLQQKRGQHYILIGDFLTMEKLEPFLDLSIENRLSVIRINHPSEYKLDEGAITRYQDVSNRSEWIDLNDSVYLDAYHKTRLAERNKIQIALAKHRIGFYEWMSTDPVERFLTKYFRK